MAFPPSSLLLKCHEELKAEFHFPLRFPALLQLSVMFLFTDVAFATLFHKDVLFSLCILFYYDLTMQRKLLITFDLFPFMDYLE